MKRKIYDAAVLVDCGRPAYVVVDGKLLRTTTVQYAHSGLGVFRTKNSFYVPSRDCTLAKLAQQRHEFFVLS